MRIIKLAVLSFLILFSIITAISLFIPSHIKMSKYIHVMGEKDSIFSLIRQKEQWTRWHPAFTPSAYSQDQASLLKSINTEVKSVSDTSLVMMVQQQGKKAVENGWLIHKSPETDSLTLQWYMEFNLSWYPWQKFGSLFYESTYGRMMEMGLHNLQQQVQQHDTWGK